MAKQKKDCGECARKDLLEGLEDTLTGVPEPMDSGFGAHDGYVCGLLSGIVCHIQAVKAELIKLENDSMQDGSLFKKE